MCVWATEVHFPLKLWDTYNDDLFLHSICITRWLDPCATINLSAVSGSERHSCSRNTRVQSESEFQ